jgi:hypothetical protein
LAEWQNGVVKGHSESDGPIRAAVELNVEPLEGGNRSKVTVTIDFTGHPSANSSPPWSNDPKPARR